MHNCFVVIQIKVIFYFKKIVCEARAPPAKKKKKKRNGEK